jgi:hypothetical protein
MSSIWVHLASHSVSDHLPIKNGKAGYAKFWMISGERLQVRELGERYLTNTSSAEYEFGGKVISEMTINGTLVLVVDAGTMQFYVEQWRASESVINNGYFGKFVKGKGRLTMGEYPYNMGVEEVKVTPLQIIKVIIPQNKILHNDNATSVPMYLSPDEYTDADTQIMEEITAGSEDEAFYLIQYQLAI